MKIGKNNIYQKEFIFIDHSLLFCCCCVIYGKILCIVGYKIKNIRSGWYIRYRKRSGTTYTQTNRRNITQTYNLSFITTQRSTLPTYPKPLKVCFIEFIHILKRSFQLDHIYKVNKLDENISINKTPCSTLPTYPILLLDETIPKPIKYIFLG